MNATVEPVIGWRLWRLRGSLLESWAVEDAWQPGENLARCLTPKRNAGRPHQPPGRWCMCGFWILRDPWRCMAKALERPRNASTVLGLATGWGTVSVHGDEGFRAERARVRCLFTDWPAMLRQLDVRRDPPARWCKVALCGMHFDPHPRLPPHPANGDLRAAAARYGVPLIPLTGAIRIGLLLELGIPRSDIVELREWLNVTAV